ncbi:MAG TPA: hypothetical protein VLM89_12610 [Phycisphaerae bacterium]|nr:hypothetical protein [Phycisphaerae bacterium]
MRDLLNAGPTFLSKSTAQSPRAAGDAIQKVVSDHFKEILGGVCAEYSASFARRAMADLAFQDVDGLYYVVDVKTHRTDTKFNMPNLTSVERLARFYEDDTNYFSILMVSYEVRGVNAVVSEVKFAPIEFLDWGCLTVGALGWGQIQIANANNITVNPGYSRKAWMIEFCDVMLEFYPKEMRKISERVTRFQEVRTFWLNRPND